MLKSLVNELPQLPFRHYYIRAKQVHLLIAAELRESWKLSRRRHNSRLQFLEALPRVSHQIHYFGANILIIFLDTNVDNIANLIEHIASKALRNHDIVYLFIISVIIVLIDELISQYTFGVKVIWLIGDLRELL